MEMKVNAPLIKQSREGRGWSQEHLASITGLSARTIQRIETTGVASAESKMALASALEIDVSALITPPQESPGPIIPALGRKSQAWKIFRYGFSFSCILYVLVCGGLLIADISRHGGVTWSKWPTLGWGLGLALWYLSTMRCWPRPSMMDRT